ncbi:MAG: twin-arginine translocation signal domain-containing protein, partial [Sphingomonas sp.]
MNRRDFVQATAAVAAVAVTGVRAATARRRPNLLYVFSDQHRAASLPGEPFNQAAAPNLDAFRHANFSMDRCVSNYPLCTPYRGILMSGRWPYQTGLTRNNVALPSNEISLGR